MKHHLTIFGFILVSCLFVTACKVETKSNQVKPAASGHAHSEDGHDHEHGHDHDHDHDHDHGPTIEDGPNGGRLLTTVEPHLELFILPDRKIQLMAVDDTKQPILLSGQSASAVCGSRANPTQLAFAETENVLISDKAIPAGLDVPIVLTLNAPGKEKVVEKIQLNLRQCPECPNIEYACTCDHQHAQ